MTADPGVTGLATAGACAVLIGSDSHVAGSELPAPPAVATTPNDLEAALRNTCGIDPGRIHRVPGGASSAEVTAAVERVVEEAAGGVLLHYLGHGLPGPGGELYLATRASTSPDRRADAVTGFGSAGADD